MSSDKVLAETAATIEEMQEQSLVLMRSIDASLVAIRDLERRLLIVIDEQAGDRRLWNPQPAPGGDVEYMQLALRRLHEAVKGTAAADSLGGLHVTTYNPLCSECCKRVGLPVRKSGLFGSFKKPPI